ncbi:hypothetical protein V8Z74_14550 [Comamonas sp. w2-DMI]|uniref:hypothetical protein n=1 Tax=Comamonas sp. w2-DMI TaxID=3126391 RepID=UPI0032E4E6A2
MGAASNQRGDNSIRRGLYAEIEQRQTEETSRLALQVAEDCNVFVREALAYLVDPRGLRQKTVEKARLRRGWDKRHSSMMAAHSKWVDIRSSNVQAFHYASVKRAQAAYELLTFALMGWTVPNHIRIPRAAIPRT